MRILGITNRFPRPGHEGIAVYHRELFRALSASHQVRLIVPVPWTDRMADSLRGKNTPRKYLNQDQISVEHPTFYYTPRLWQHRYGQMYLASVGKVARQAIAEFQPDIIFSSWAHPDGWASVKLGQQAGIPVIIKVIGSDILVLRRNPRRAAEITSALRQATSVIAVSEDLKNQIVAMNVPANKVYVVHEGLDQSIFHPGSQGQARERLGLPKDSRLVLFVGNILFSKGVGVLIEACRQMQSAGCVFSCLIVGDGANSADIRNLISKYGLGTRVSMIGFRAPAVLADLYRASNLVVLPSFSEGIPNVLREAVACGRPYVATTVGGIPEISSPDFSRLVPPHDVDALATAIVQMLDAEIKVDSDLSRRHSNSWNAVAGLLTDRMAAVLNRNATSLNHG